MANDTFVRAETVILSFLISAGALTFVLKRLQVRRPGFRVGTPLATAFGLRLLAIAGISSTGLQDSLRGGDEKTFMYWAHALADLPIGKAFFPHQPKFPLHTVTFAIQLKFGDFSDGALRVTQVGIALMGVLLIVAAVHDLAGGRAARITMWVLAFEPASIFFNSILHKEPLMDLAGGLMVFGGTKLWRRLDLSGLILMALGGFIAVTTRPYAGWFLVSAGVLIILHASIRRRDRTLRAMPLVYAVIIAGFVAMPAIVQVTSHKSLTALQQSQDANASTAGIAGNNLALESVNYSTRGHVISSLPKRIKDVLIRPYPWQVGNASQQLGAIGSLFALACFALLVREAVRRRRHLVAMTGPLLYVGFFLLIAYALSAGNAGTGFRYRTHIVVLAVAVLVSLRVGRAREEAVDEPASKPALPPRRERPLAAVQ